MEGISHGTKRHSIGNLVNDSMTVLLCCMVIDGRHLWWAKRTGKSKRSNPCVLHLKLMWHCVSSILKFWHFTKKRRQPWVINLTDCIQTQLWKTARFENWFKKEFCDKMSLTLKVFANNSCADDHSIFWTHCDSYVDYNNIRMFKPLATYHSDSTWPGLICVWNLNLVPQRKATTTPTFFHTPGWPNEIQLAGFLSCSDN